MNTKTEKALGIITLVAIYGFVGWLIWVVISLH